MPLAITVLGFAAIVGMIVLGLLVQGVIWIIENKLVHRHPCPRCGARNWEWDGYNSGFME
jgi:hypothetical protein